MTKAIDISDLMEVQKTFELTCMKAKGRNENQLRSIENAAIHFCLTSAKTFNSLHNLKPDRMDGNTAVVEIGDEQQELIALTIDLAIEIANKVGIFSKEITPIVKKQSFGQYFLQVQATTGQITGVHNELQKVLAVTLLEQVIGMFYSTGMDEDALHGIMKSLYLARTAELLETGMEDLIGGMMTGIKEAAKEAAAEIKKEFGKGILH